MNTINVLDVRASSKIRKQVAEAIKDNNYLRGSKYIKPSVSVRGESYNKSYKPKKQDNE